jgi:hypothetical protein
MRFVCRMVTARSATNSSKSSKSKQERKALVFVFFLRFIVQRNRSISPIITGFAPFAPEKGLVGHKFYFLSEK